MLRLMTLGLCAANVVMLATWQPARVERLIEVAPPRAPVPPAPHDADLRVVDVSYGVAPAMLAAALRLGPDEHITAINDQPVRFEPDAAVVLASLDSQPGAFVDLAVAGRTSERRILVLLH